MDFQDILLDMICSSADNDFVEYGIKANDACDLLTVKAKDFFGDVTPEFNSIPDVLYKVFKATKGEFVVIGIVNDDGETGLFTNDDVIEQFEEDKKLQFGPESYIIVARRTL